MKLPTLLPAMALITLLSFSCSTDAIEEDKIEAIASTYVPETKTIEVEVLELINNHRINLGLTSLNGMSAIKAQAFGHTDYMIEKGVSVATSELYSENDTIVLGSPSEYLVRSYVLDSE